MSLSREYRIRELYLKFLEENFSRERAREFVNILGDSEVKLIKRLSRVNQVSDGMRSESIFYAYLFSLFESYTRRRSRISSLKELRRFRRHFSYIAGGDYSSKRLRIVEALDNCKLFEIQDEEGAEALAKSMALFQEFLDSLQKTALPDFSIALKEFVTRKVSALLSDEPYLLKVRLYGQLMQTPTQNAASDVEAVRLALQCMPIGDQKTANIFLYIIIKVYGLWPEVPPRLLHVPADTDLSRVILRIGMTRRKIGNLEYGSIGYSAFQTLARRLAPENPSSLYGLKRIAKLWCKSRSTDCDQCPMSNICSYAQSLLC